MNPRQRSAPHAIRAPIVAPLLAGALLCAAAAGAPVHAQAPAAAVPPDSTDFARSSPPAAQADGSGAVEPFAPAGHWSRAALRRLAGLGLLEQGQALAAWPLRRQRVRELFADAAALAEQRGDAAAAALAHGWAQRFDRELPPPVRRGGLSWTGGGVSAGWRGTRDALKGGTSEWVEDVGWRYHGPVQVPDTSELVLAATADLSGPGPLAASATVSRFGERPRLDEAYLSATFGGADVWIGRRGFGPGVAHGEGIVLSERAGYDGVGIEVPGEGTLPGPFRALGPVHAALLVARMERSGPVDGPWFLGMRVAVSPHPSLSLGLNRAALFGGQGNIGVTPRRVLLMLAGLTDVEGKDSDFENQVASVDFAWRFAAGALPLAVYGEWGFDDVGFGWTNVPGLTLGAELAAVPALPAVAAGIEHTRFARSCCGNPPWYRHGGLPDGWTDRGQLLGHPLGGHGEQWAARLRLDRPDSGLLLDLRVLVRDRGQENVFAPDRAGRSIGGAAGIVGFGPAGLRLHLDADLERGQAGAWRTWSLTGGAELRF